MSELEHLIREIVREELAHVLAATTPAADGYLRVADAAALASTTTRTIRRWIKSGKLVPHGVGRVVRVRRADLEKLLRDGARLTRNPSPEDLAERDFG